jgi:choline dehydrogenase-like flavoprotein
MGGPRAAGLSARQRQTLVAIAEAAMPAGAHLPAAGAATVERFEELFARQSSGLRQGFLAILAGLDGYAWLTHRRSLRALPPTKRLEVMERWRGGDAVRRLALRVLTTPLKVAHFDDPALYQRLGCVYRQPEVRGEGKPPYAAQRTHDGARSQGDLELECDVVVIGTGAGGAVVGKELAEAGCAVVFVEEGGAFERGDFNGRAFEMQQLLYRRQGATFSVGNVAIPIPLGQTVGGSTTVNSGTCYRAPERVLLEWRDHLGLSELGPEQMGPYFDRVEAILQVEEGSPRYLGGNARVIARGCEALGLRRHHALRRNAPACDGKGVCVFGCPTDAKRSTNVSYVPLAQKAGAELFTRTKVTAISREAGRASGVVATTAAGHRVTVRARAVVVAGGSLLTPLLLQRNQLGGASGQLGKNLSIHPAAGLLAEMNERIEGYNAIPQGYAIEDFAEDGILFEGAATPVEMSMGMISHLGARLTELAESFDRVSSFGFMIEDTSRGAVRHAWGQPLITYRLNDADVARIKRGVDLLAQVYFAAGARTVIAPIHGFEELRGPAELVALRAARLRAADLDLSAYHPLGTARIGRDPRHSVVDVDHQLHDTPGVYVVDGSAVPTSLGVNPQVTIMALATRAAERIAAAL